MDKPNLRGLSLNQLGGDKGKFLEKKIEEVECSTGDKASELNGFSFIFFINIDGIQLTLNDV